MKQLRGEFAVRINALREELIGFAGLLELELDFAEEDVEFADREKFDALLAELLERISRLADSFRHGNAIREGVPVAILGAPNRGKSTLLNALLGDDRAIVSATPGTTRDTVEDTCVMEGIKFRFIDTAGIRETRRRHRIGRHSTRFGQGAIRRRRALSHGHYVRRSDQSGRPAS